MLIYLQMIDSPEDRSKFEELYMMYRNTMYAVAMSILHDPYEAEDVVHYAFVKIIENFSKIFEIDCPKTRGYIVTIVRNRAIDIYRRRKAHPQSPYTEVFSGITTEYNGDNALTSCILKLPLRQRSIIILKYHYGYELREIAKMLGITYVNALTTERRAKKKLETFCKEEELI